MQLQPALAQPGSDPLTRITGLLLSETMHHDVIAEALERQAREFPRHPCVERVMEKEVCEQRRGHAPNAVGNFCFEVTLGYRRVERGR